MNRNHEIIKLCSVEQRPNDNYRCGVNYFYFSIVGRIYKSGPFKVDAFNVFCFIYTKKVISLAVLVMHFLHLMAFTTLDLKGNTKIKISSLKALSFGTSFCVSGF